MAWQQGEALPSLQREVTLEGIRRYAHASGDFNPVHLDGEFAAKTSFGGIVAHGMLLLAYLSEMMARAFGRRWAEGGRLKVRFLAPARPGDRVTAFGEVARRVERDGAPFLECRVGCRNQRGEDLVSGEALVPLGKEEP